MAELSSADVLLARTSQAHTPHPPHERFVWCDARRAMCAPRYLATRPSGHGEEIPIEPSRDGAAPRRFAFGIAEEQSGQFDLKRFMRLARGMGIPSDDAARLAMNIVIEQRRDNDQARLRLT